VNVVGGPRMVVSSYARGPVTVVALTGELDSATAHAARGEVLAAVPAGGRLVLDLGRLTYLSSAGIRTLLLVHRYLRELDVPVVVCGMSDDIREIMRVTGFLGLFRSLPSLDDGLRELGG